MSLAIVIGSVGLVILAAILAAWSVRRARASADERVAEAVRRLAEGMEDTMRDLAEAVSAAHAASRQAGFLGEPVELEFEDVAEHALSAASAVPGVEGALLETLGPTGAIVSSVAGLSAAETASADVELPMDAGLSAAHIAYRFRADAEAAATSLQSGVVVPLRIAGARVGTLSAFSRQATGSLPEASVEELEQLGRRAAPALWNARRYAEARAQADLDPLTGLHNRRYFNELLGREVSRAHRYRRRLSLLVLRLDRPDDDMLVELADLLKAAARSADVPCRVGDAELAVILPEADPGGPELLARRLGQALRGGDSRVAAGTADLQQGDRERELLERARAALAETAPPGAGAADSA